MWWKTGKTFLPLQKWNDFATLQKTKSVKTKNAGSFQTIVNCKFKKKKLFAQIAIAADIITNGSLKPVTDYLDQHLPAILFERERVTAANEK